MNYLQLCQEMVREAGIGGSGPIAVTNQPLEYQKVLMWVRRAWETIQGQRPDWKFMWQSWSYSLPAGESLLLPATASITDLKVWDTDSIWMYADGKPTEKAPLKFMRLEEFIGRYERYALATGKPQNFTEDYTKALKLSSITDQIYVMGGRYYRTNQVLALANDTPLMPADYHTAIAYKALMMYAAHEEAGNIYADAKANWAWWETRMVNELAPEMALREIDVDEC